MSIAAYRQRQEAAEQPRELERRAFSIVIGKLVEGKERGGRLLVDACFLNHQLWSALLADLALPQNALPDDLKARLISLALWVQRYTPGVMQGTASPDPLISVNRNILDGLSVGPAVNAAPAAATPSLEAV
jgi:flagellar biosynthesis activator protein FlaF